MAADVSGTRNLTNVMRIALISSARLAAHAVECAAADGGRSVASETVE